jgi:hypothetical protein
MPTIVSTPQSLCRFGIARGDVTPPVGFYHRLWGAATHDRATGVHRPLTASAMAMGPHEGSSDLYVLVALDHCRFWDDVMTSILETVSTRANIYRDQLLIAFSHTHAAGMVDLSRTDRPGGELIAGYVESLTDRLGEIVVEALSRVEPATISYGSGRCTLAAHRAYRDDAGSRMVCGFNPEGAADDTVWVARVNGADGGLRATIVNYACHPTTLAWDNALISPDYPGATREVVEQATGAPCVFLLGACGNLGPRDGFVGDPAVADRNGRQLGYAALAVSEEIAPPQTRFEYAGAVESGTAIGTWHHVPLNAADRRALSIWRERQWSIDLPYRADLPTREGTRRDREKWERDREAAVARGDQEQAAVCRAFVERMDRQLTRFGDLPEGPCFPFAIRVWQAGDAIWVAVGGEHYDYFQVELRRRFPNTPIVVMTLINTWCPAYVPTAQTYGRGIYEEQLAVVEPGSLERLVDAIATQISEWVGPRPSQ